MLFFQISLLAGYAYAHVLIRSTKARSQVTIHTLLLAVSCLILPIIPSSYWKPTAAGDPTLRILLLLGATIGLPLAVSAMRISLSMKVGSNFAN